MAQLKYAAFASAILLACDFAASIPIGDPWKEYNGTVIIDRLNTKVSSPGYFMPLNGVDRTTFALNQDVWLERFYITRIYEYNNSNNYPSLKENKIAYMKIYETDNNGKNRSIYAVNAVINPYNEAEVQIYPEIPLSWRYMYEIQVQIPHENGTMYYQSLDIKEFYANTTQETTIGVKFYQKNPLDILPPNITDFSHKLTQGVVRSLYLKY